MSGAIFLLQAGGNRHALTRPSSYGISRYGSNPPITISGAETHEMYVPAGVRLANGDIYVYVKGSARIYAWKSTDGGTTFSIANSSNQVVGPGGGGAWDAGAVLEPMTVYDSASGTIHLWYKGYAAGIVNPAIGHATASDSDPLTFTKDAGNPILTAANAATQLGGGSVTDLSTGSVIKVGSTYHFYLYAEHSSTYKIVKATGSSWNNPSGTTALYSAPGSPITVVETPDVIRLNNGLWLMLYSAGGAQPDPRYVRAAYSVDASTWDFSDTTNILSPTGSGWEKDETYSGHFIKENGSPYARPYRDSSGRYLFYYSGLNVNVAQSGLAYMTPA